MASSDNLLVVTIIIIAVILLIAGSCFLCQRMYVSFWRTNRKLSLRVTAAAAVGSRQRNTSAVGVGSSWNDGESGGGNSVYTIPVEDSAGNTSFIVVQTCQSRPIFIEPLCEAPPPSYEDCVKTKPINYTALPIIHV